MSSTDVDAIEEDRHYTVAEGDENLRRLGALREGFASLVSDLPDLPQQVSAAVHDLSDGIGSLYEIMADGAEGAAGVVDDAISEHPWVGFWVGVSAGILATAIFRRIREK